MVVTNKTEQGRQYKEYTREATGNKAERSAQLLGGEFWYDLRSSLLTLGIAQTCLAILSLNRKLRLQ